MCTSSTAAAAVISAGRSASLPELAQNTSIGRTRFPPATRVSMAGWLTSGTWPPA